ncbi:MAG TPA: chemotaxis protein CheW [Acidimicrobiia bacterium]|nr:chemotaxis protein CheW [Acidimicrobiia bacterium]
MSTPDDDHVERVLAERARLLARPLEEPDRRALDDVVVLEAGGERYAIALTSVERVHPVDAVTVVPGLRPPWAGLVSLRGEILPALDLPSYLGRPPAPAGAAAGRPAASCAIVAHGGLRVALLSEAPVELAARPEGGLSAPLTETVAPPGVVVGVTDDLLTIVDVATILADPALVVDD